MNSTSPTSRLLLALCSLALPVSPCFSRAEDQVIKAEDIAKQVVDTGLTRSFRVDQRKGLQYDASRSITVEPWRSLVEVEIMVEPGANLSVPIRFELDSSDRLADEVSRLQLDEMAKALKGAAASDSYLIEGHTCVRGDTDHNNRLSIARANFVIQALAKRGVTVKMTAIGCGPAEAAQKGLTAAAGEAALAPCRKVMLLKMAQ